VLLEVPEERARPALQAALRRGGFEVSVCTAESECSLLVGDRCGLVDQADVVVHALTGARGRAIRMRLPAASVVRTTSASTGSDVLEAVRRRYAGPRARRRRFHFMTRDGRRLLIRAIRPSDRGRLRQFDRDLSDPTRQLRYLGFMPPMSQEWAAHLATPDFGERFAFVAMAGRRLVGDCRLVPAEAGGLEMAIVVADEFQGAGVGRVLLEAALRTAAERGLPVVAEVRYDNQPMAGLLRSLGFQRTGWDLGVMTFRWSPPPLW